MAEPKLNAFIRREVALFAPHVVPGDAVLDIGCGNGLFAAALAEYTGCDIWGADVAPHLRCNLPYATMAAPERTGFASLAFDVALLRGVLHHLPLETQGILLHDALRVSRRVLLLEPLPGFWARLADRLENAVRLHKKFLPMSHRAPDGWRELAQGAGRVLSVGRVQVPLSLAPLYFIEIESLLKIV